MRRKAIATLNNFGVEGGGAGRIIGLASTLCGRKEGRIIYFNGLRVKGRGKGV